MDKVNNILIIENQITQYREIKALLKNNGFNALPADETEYKQFTDLVRIHINLKRYKKTERTENVFGLIVQEIEKYDIDLFMVDYKLSGCHEGSNGIDFAVELAGKFPDKPFVFLSRTPFNTKEIKESAIQSLRYSWVEKGYAGTNLLDESYFNRYVVSSIYSLLAKNEVSNDAFDHPSVRQMVKKLIASSIQMIKELCIDVLKKIDSKPVLDANDEQLIQNLYYNLPASSQTDVERWIKTWKKLQK